MKFFRQETSGKVVVMGRKTLESFPNGLPLKNRTNIVLTSDPSYQVKDAIIVHDLPELLKEFQVIHLCGKGKMDESLNGTEGYVQYEYIKEELPDLFALSDVVISRAGANAICEISALHKPNLLIPLSANASRGDQILNARSFERQGFSMVMEEEELTDEKLLAAVHKLYDSREDFINAMNQSSQQDPIKTIIGLIEDAASK